MLHRKLRRVLEAEDLIEGSHDYKSAVALFDTFPKDELFAAPVDDLRRAVVALLALEGTDRVRLLGRRAADGRSASFILALPRDRYRTLLVDRVRKLFMRNFKTRDVEAQHVLGEGDGARARALPSALGRRPARRRERADSSARSSSSRAPGTTPLRDALVERFGAQQARLLWSIWGARLPDHYKGYTNPNTGATDIALLEQLAEDGPFLVSLQPAADPHARGALRARAEDRAGRRAADARGPRAARDRGDLDAARRRRRTWVQEFRVFGPDGGPLDIEAVGDRVAELLAAVHRGDAETDPSTGW